MSILDKFTKKIKKWFTKPDKTEVEHKAPLDRKKYLYPAGGSEITDESEGVQLNGYFIYNNKVRKETYELLENSLFKQPKFSRAVGNIIDFATTRYNITFDGEANQKYNRIIEKWLKDNNVGGSNGLFNSILMQLVIYGATSFDMIIDEKYKCKRVHFISPKNITFILTNGEQIAHQEIVGVTNNSNSVNGNLIPLNNIFTYIPIRSLNSVPYGIPPFITALESLENGNGVLKSIMLAAKNMGLLGFLQVLITELDPEAYSTEEEYLNATNSAVKSALAEAKKGLANGIVAGVKGNHEFILSPSINNSAGAGDLVDINNEEIYSGLKQDGLFHGVPKSMTDALARLLVSIMTSQIDSYQKVVSTAFERICKFILLCEGIHVDNISVKLEPPVSADTYRQHEARAIEINYHEVLYQMGVISQEEKANLLGFTKSAEKESLVVRNIEEAKPRGLANQK